MLKPASTETQRSDIGLYFSFSFIAVQQFFLILVSFPFNGGLEEQKLCTFLLSEEIL